MAFSPFRRPEQRVFRFRISGRAIVECGVAKFRVNFRPNIALAASEEQFSAEAQFGCGVKAQR